MLFFVCFRFTSFKSLPYCMCNLLYVGVIEHALQVQTLRRNVTESPQ